MNLGLTISGGGWIAMIFVCLFNITLNLAFWMTLMWWAAKLIAPFFGIEITI